jgi:hypothetical protein
MDVGVIVGCMSSGVSRLGTHKRASIDCCVNTCVNSRGRITHRQTLAPLLVLLVLGSCRLLQR